MTTPRTERIERLPGWAQRYIEGLERRIDDWYQTDALCGLSDGATLTRRESRAAVIIEDTAARRWGDRK